MIANPLNTTNNTLNALLTDVPPATQVLKWNGSGFDVSTFAFGSWDQNFTLNPGEGAFINLGAAHTLTFVGEVMQGSLTNSIPAGYSIRGSQVPQSGGVTTVLGLSQLASPSQILIWTGSSYNLHTLVFGSWDPTEPQINVGQSFFVNSETAVQWTRTFSVN
jgi:hypothetical protein